jgi:hypothetical protein
MSKIVIDLAKLPEAFAPNPQLSSCKYTTPCIIGSLMTPEEREHLANTGHDGHSVDYLMRDGYLDFADRDMRVDAINLQRLWDARSGGFASYLAAVREKWTTPS